MKVLITGAAGRLGRILVRELGSHGYSVVGIDRRPWSDAPVPVFETDLLKRSAEDVFRTERPEAVVHCASVSQVNADPRERHRVNLVGTQAVFEHSARYGVGHTVFVGRHTYYGASADSPLYHTEDEPPLGLETFPEAADLVAADLYAGSVFWRMPTMVTTVLRFVYTLGPSKTGVLADFLEGPRVPMVLGFDPLFQFMHEDDAAAAIARVLSSRLRGVYNVAGPPPLPLSVLIRETGRARVVLPEVLLRRALGRFGLPQLPTPALSHVKYPLVIDDRRFRSESGLRYRHGQLETLRQFAGLEERPELESSASKRPNSS